MILHVPHSSTGTLGKEFLCDLGLELERMTDHSTDTLFDYPSATKVIFSISRLLCDVERFEDDAMEEMAKKGMGVCYTTNSFGEPLRIVSEQERPEIIKKYYRPHHKALTEAVEKELQIKGTALVVDCHSFSNTPLPHEDSQTTPRPDICIGTDDFHTPKQLLDEAVKYFESCGYSVAINSPFAGTLIPMKYYQKDKNVEGIMIEVNRDLYKDDFDSVQKNISSWLSSLDLNNKIRVIKKLLLDDNADYTIQDIFNEDELAEFENEIIVYTLDQLDIEYDYDFCDESEGIFAYIEDDETITDDARVEHGLWFIEECLKKIYSKDIIYENLQMYKTVNIDGEKIFICFEVPAENHGMGLDVGYANAFLVGVFKSYEELKQYYRDLDYFILDDSCDEYCIQKRKEFILKNWKY